MALPGARDSRYYEQVRQPGGDVTDESGGVMNEEWRLRPEYAHLATTAQVGDENTPSYVRDRGQVRYDPEFGYITDTSNLDVPQGVGDYLSRATQIAAVAVPAMMMGGMMPGIEGAFGAGAGSAGAGSLGLDAAEVASLAPGYGADAAALDLTNVGLGQGVGTDSIYSLGPNAPDLSTISGPIEQGTSNSLLDPIRDWGTRLMSGTGGVMPSAGGADLGWGDLLNYGSRLAGTYSNNQSAGENREASARENQLTREQQLLLAMVNQDTPYGSVEYTRDPVTGAIRRTATMNPEDQAILNGRRGIQQQVMDGTYQMAGPDYSTPYINMAMGGRQMNPPRG
jgi:hypothetical protein